MIFQFPFPPPGSPEFPPPGPLYRMLGLLVVLGWLAELVLLALPEPWRIRIVRALLRGVWPFPQVDAWLRAQIK